MSTTNAQITNHAKEVSQKWFGLLEKGLEEKNETILNALFLEDSYWRDFISISWNIITSEGKSEIIKFLENTYPNIKPKNFVVTEASIDKDVVESWFTFETNLGKGKGILRLKEDKCWTILTALQELDGFEEKKGRNRSRGTDHGIHKNRKSWLEIKEEEEAALGYSKQPYVVVIGGGQGGIALGARLKKLGVPHLVIDKHPKPGDQWRSRYKSLCLHDPVWYDHLPYLPFPEDWPVFCPKDKVGDWLEAYTKIMEINYWSNSEVLKANFDEDKKEWEVTINRDGNEVKVYPKQLVFALGVSGFPSVPKIPGAEAFEGMQHHSSQHPGGEAFKGKKVVVIGSNNSAHDICADLWENDVDVTMLQRSSTHIIQSDTFIDKVLKPLFSEDAIEKGISTDKADLLFASVPYKILQEAHIPLYNEIAEIDKDFYDGLRKAGFLLDFGEDGSGLFLKYLRRGSGYYINVGACELVANGSIKLKSGVEIDHINAHGIAMKDGDFIPADVIVYATGFGSMSQWVEKIVSKEVADKVGKCWGLGSNTTKDPGPWVGELRNMWKPTAQENLWFHGGNLHQSRHYSKYMALQLKARFEGLETPVYSTEESSVEVKNQLA